ncbi:unnamed protein product [Cunninghamella echinulata]
MTNKNNNTCGLSSIEDRKNDPGLKLVEKLIDHLKLTLINENKRRRKSTLPPIIVLAGLVGFCDEYVHDYYTNTKMKHDHKIDSDLIKYLHPLKNLNKLLDLIELVPQQTPSILTIDITDGNELHSRLVWANLPSMLSEYSSYNKTTENLMETVKAWNNAHFDGFIGSKNFAMSTALLKLFDGSYRTMVFNQFNEYIPKLDSNNFIDVLQFTSLLQNINCSVTLGQFERKNMNKNMVEHFENITQMQKKIEVLQIKQDILATSIKEKLHKSIELKEKETKYEIVAESLHNNDLISQAKIERRRISSDWKFAQMKETIRQYKIALVQAETSRASFESTQKDIEYELEDRQSVSKELADKKNVYRHHIDQLFAKLQQTKEQLRENEKIAEDGPTKRKLAFDGLHKKWEAIEFYYMNCFEESEKRIEKLKLEKGMLLQEQKKIARLQLQDLYGIPATRPDNNELSSSDQLSPLLNHAIEFNDKMKNDVSLYDKPTFQPESNKHSFRVQQLSSSLNNLVVDFNGKKNNGTSLYDKSATQPEKSEYGFTEQQLLSSLDNVANINNKRNNHTFLYDNSATQPESNKYSSTKQQFSSPLNNIQVDINDKRNNNPSIKDDVVLRQKVNIHLDMDKDDDKPATQSENKDHSTTEQQLLSPLKSVLVDFDDKKNNDTSFKHDIVSATESENNDHSSIEQQLSPPLNSVTNINDKKNNITSSKNDTISATQYEDNEDFSVEQQLPSPPVNVVFNFNDIKNKYNSLKKDNISQQKVDTHIEIGEDEDDDDDDDDDDGSLFVPPFDKPPYRTLPSGTVKEDDSIGIGLFSLKSKLVSKPLSDNDSEESSFIPARPRPQSSVEEKKSKKRKQVSKEQPSSSSQIPKAIIRKDSPLEKEESQQPPTLVKKKRKLRPNKAIIDELGMSPVLGGYTANFFKSLDKESLHGEYNSDHFRNLEKE